MSPQSAIVLFFVVGQKCEAGPVTCNASLWTEQKNTDCPRSCMAVAVNMGVNKNCRNFCALQQITGGGGLDCVGAWDDKQDKCTDAGGDEPVTAPVGKTTCDFDFGATGTSDGVCECKAPTAGSAPIVADKTQMEAPIDCGKKSNTQNNGQPCLTKDDDSRLLSVLAGAGSCAKWVASGMPEVQGQPVKGKGCDYCVGFATIKCAVCAGSCAAAREITGQVGMDVKLPAGVTAAAFAADPKVKTGIAKGIAGKLTDVTADMISVTIADVSSLIGRFTGVTSFTVDYKITVPADKASKVTGISIALKSADADKAAWGTSLGTAISTETGATYTATVTSIPDSSTKVVPSAGVVASDAPRGLSHSCRVVLAIASLTLLV